MVNSAKENQLQDGSSVLSSSASAAKLQQLTSKLLNRAPLQQLDLNQQHKNKILTGANAFSNKFQQISKAQPLRKTATTGNNTTCSAFSAQTNRQIPPWLPSSRFNQLSRPPPLLSTSSAMTTASFQPSSRVRTLNGSASAASAPTATASDASLSGVVNNTSTNNNNKRKLKLFEISAQEGARYENLAWLDMLLYLVESRYGPYTLPITLDSYHFTKRRRTGTSAQASSANQVASTCKGSATISASSYGYLNRFADSSASESTATLLKPHAGSAKKRKLHLLQRHAKQIHDSSVISSSCCGCKTGCLKMYCVCFSARGFCHAKCSCANCLNQPSSNTRLEAIQNHLLNDPRAFANAAPKTDCSSGFQLLLPQKSSTVVLRGCRCKKSKCQKNYCECFQNDVACTSHCRCVDCANHQHIATAALNAKSGILGSGKTSMGGANTSSLHQHVAVKSSCKIICNESFRQIQLLVTKKPKRNFVQKSIRLSL